MNGIKTAALPQWSRPESLVFTSPVIGTVSSGLFGAGHASVHLDAAYVVFLISLIDAATLILEFVRP